MKHVFKRAALVAALACLAVWGSQHASAEMPRVKQGSAWVAGEQSSEAGSPLWFDDFDAGWRESKRRGVPMLVFITSDHCVYCDAMKQDVWCNEQIAGELRQHFVAIQLQRERDSKLLSRIQVPSYPTTLVASPAGKVMEHRIGYQPVDQIRRLFSEIAQRQRR